MKQNKPYMTPESEQILIRFENNIMSDPLPGGSENGGDNPYGPSF